MTRDPQPNWYEMMRLPVAWCKLGLAKLMVKCHRDQADIFQIKEGVIGNIEGLGYEWVAGF